MTLQRPWESHIQQELQSYADFHIDIHNTFDADSRTLSVSIDIESQLELSSQYSISVMILESHIIDVQEDSDGIVPDYEHNHVLRTMLTPALGEPIAGTFSTLEIQNREYSFTLPAEDGTWIAENMAVLAFVSEYNEDCSCSTVVQAGEAKFIE